MHFIVEGLTEARPDLLEVGSDFPILRKNSKGGEVALPAINEDCMRLQQRARQFGALLKDTDASVAERMTPVLAASTEQVSALHTKLADTVKQFKELCKWLGEDPNATQPEELFGWVRGAVVQGIHGSSQRPAAFSVQVAGFVGSVGEEARLVREKIERAQKLEARKAKEAAQRAAPAGERTKGGGRKPVIVRTPGPARGVVAADLISQSKQLRKTPKAQSSSSSPRGGESPPSSNRRSVRLVFNAKGGVTLSAPQAASPPAAATGLRRSVSMRESEGSGSRGESESPTSSRSPPARNNNRASVAGTAIALSLAASAADAMKTHRGLRGGIDRMAASAGLVESGGSTPAQRPGSPPGVQPALMRSQSGPGAVGGDTGVYSGGRQRAGSRGNDGRSPPPPAHLTSRPSIFQARLDEISGAGGGGTAGDSSDVPAFDDDADLREFERKILRQQQQQSPDASGSQQPPSPPSALPLPQLPRSYPSPPLMRHGSVRVATIPEEVLAETSGDESQVHAAEPPAASRGAAAAAYLGHAPPQKRVIGSIAPSAAPAATVGSASRTTQQPPAPATAAAAMPPRGGEAERQDLLSRLARLAAAPVPSAAGVPAPPPPGVAPSPASGGSVAAPPRRPPLPPPLSAPAASVPRPRTVSTDAAAAAVAASQAAVLADATSATAAFGTGGTSGLQSLLASLSAASAASAAAQRPSGLHRPSMPAAAPAQGQATPAPVTVRPNSAALSSAALSYLTRS